jgi:hypothetical protein
VISVPCSESSDAVMQCHCSGRSSGWALAPASLPPSIPGRNSPLTPLHATLSQISPLMSPSLTTWCNGNEHHTLTRTHKHTHTLTCSVMHTLTGSCTLWKFGLNCQPTCSILDIKRRPSGAAPAMYGYSPNVTSWGGNVVAGDDGLYHLYVSEMVGGCGLNTWSQFPSLTSCNLWDMAPAIATPKHHHHGSPPPPPPPPLHAHALRHAHRRSHSLPKFGQ